MNDMTKAYDLAALAVRRRFAEQHPDRLDVLDSMSKKDIAVYTGAHDSVQYVLQRLKIPYQLDPAKLASLVFANCSSNHPQVTDRIEPHVREGGWLVSSDWSLQCVVQAAFPDTVRYAGGRSTGDEVVGVEPELDSYWSEVVVLGTNPQWWLESASYPITIVDRQRVRVEAASHEMLVKYNAPAVAVHFNWEAGHVFHVISHFWLKRSRTPGERYQKPCTEFLQQGMRLSEEGIAEILKEAKVQPEEINFATMQSAATSTELIAQLCYQAKRAQA